MKRIPHAYQNRAENFLYDDPFSGLFLEPGLGKTSIFLSLFCRLKKERKTKGVLVITPLRPAFLVWPAEIKKWDQFNHLKYVVLHGDNKNELLWSDADVFIINPEGLPWLTDALRGIRRTKWPFDMLGIDESTKFRYLRTKRFRLLKSIHKKFIRRHIMTGTPRPKSLLDLFGQFLIMDAGETLGTEKGEYERKYFYKAGYMKKDFKSYTGSEEKIYKRIAPKVIQMKAEDYLELPELIINPVYIDLPPSVRAEYKKMEKQLRLDYEEGRVTAFNAGILSSKCRQIASGGVYLDGDERRWKNLHDEKSRAASDLVEELNGAAAIIGYEFHHDLDRLQKWFGRDTPTIRGKLTTRRLAQIEQQWNAGQIPLMFGQTSALYLGLNIQESGNTMILHTVPCNYEVYYQIIRRLYRQGQKASHVFVHLLIAKGTVEEAVMWANLKQREKGHISLFNALKEYWGV